MVGREIYKARVPGFPTRLFVLRASFGTHGIKIITNSVIESFNSADFPGQAQGWSLFASVVVNQCSGGELASVKTLPKLIGDHCVQHCKKTKKKHGCVEA